MRDLIRDLRLAFRTLRRRPLFLGAAVLTLALGTGAGAGVFSVVESSLIRPLPFREPDRLAVVWGVAGPERDVRGASVVEIRDWDEAVDALGPLSRYNATTVNASGEGEATQLRAEMVSPGFFGILGVAPALGRALVAEDDEPGAAGSAVISYDLWQRRYGGDGAVLGREVLLNGTSFSIVGVMPAGFRGLSFDTEVWLPLGPFATPDLFAQRGGRWLAAVGRLAPGAGMDAAQAQLDAVAARLAEAYPETNGDRGAMLLPLRDFYVAGSRSLLLMVLGAVALLIAVASANVANLQLVRALERNRELAVRHALGAGRGRIARELLAESVVLAILGGAAGLALAWLGLGALVPLIPVGVLPPYASPSVDLPVLAFGLGVALLTGLAFGLVPALRGGIVDVGAVLRSGGQRMTQGSGSRRRAGAQQVIVVGEVALTLVLLVGAGMALRSLREQLAIRPGFRADGVLAATVSLSGADYDRAGRAAFARDLLERVESVAGVDAAALTSDPPLRGSSSAAFIFRAEDPVSPETRIRFYRHSVTPSFFATLGIPIVRGRGFTDADEEGSPPVVVVSEAFAARVWPGQGALGRRVLLGDDTATVVGVAGNVRQRTLTTSLMDPGEDPDVYIAYAQLPTGSFDILARTRRDAGLLAAPIRAQLSALDPSLPLFAVAPLGDALAAQTALSRLVSVLLGVFAALALAVAAVGLYGVLAFVVRGRRKELAVRSAMGAEPWQLLADVVRHGLVLGAIGVAIGLAGAVAAGRLAASLLYGVGAVEPLVLAGTALLLLLITAAASWLPARQATRVDPAGVLAEE